MTKLLWLAKSLPDIGSRDRLDQSCRVELLYWENYYEKSTKKIHFTGFIETGMISKVNDACI